MRLTVFLRFPRFGFNLRHGVTSRNRSILEDTSSQFVPVNGAGLRSMVQDGWRSGTVVALATGIDPSPLVLLSFSSLLCHILLVSLSLSLLFLFPSLSLSLYHFSLFSVEHTDTDAYIDFRGTEKRKISFLTRSLLAALLLLFFLVFWFLLTSNPASIYFSSCSKLNEKEKGWLRKIRETLKRKLFCKKCLLKDMQQDCRKGKRLRMKMEKSRNS